MDFLTLYTLSAMQCAESVFFIQPHRTVCVRIINFEFVLDKEDSFGYHIKCEKMS